MKLSLAWICDHLQHDRTKIDVPALVAKINESTAEVEDCTPVALDLDSLALATVMRVISGGAELHSDEWNSSFSITTETPLQQNGIYLIKKTAKGYRLATVRDVGGTKDLALPALTVSREELAGSWKQRCEATDTILEIDNKSINHRPDLWGHRGFAREIAALLHLPFVSDEKVYAAYPVHEHGEQANPTQDNLFTLKIEAQDTCKRLATLHLTTCAARPSFLAMALRLAKVDSRPLEAIVDTTNYVMLDTGHPMHAFDANHIRQATLTVRHAYANETLELLDGTRITLVPEDTLIADAQRVLSLAGIMGGKESGVAPTTTSVLLEAAYFEPDAIRKGSLTHKQRTEASARFEKQLDPSANVRALQRFVKVMEQHHAAVPTGTIISLGRLPQPRTITVSHTFIEERLGTSITQEFVRKCLTGLGFMVEHQDGEYRIGVPSWRAGKDIAIPEDIVEEVGRLYGFVHLSEELPERRMQPYDTQQIMRLRAIKELLAYGAHMQEVQNYAFDDDDFLAKLGWTAADRVRLKNPVADNRAYLVGSLLPGLLKNVADNRHNQEQLRFFEVARTWSTNGTDITERHEIAGILFHPKQVDFYEGKALLQDLFTALHLPVTWEKVDSPQLPLFRPYQTANLIYQGQVVGTAGKIAPRFLSQITDGDAFIFTLDGAFLRTYQPTSLAFKPLPRFQETALDVSMLVATNVAVDTLQHAVATADKRIFKVELLDIFEKAEWNGKKSVALRYHLRDDTKTLTKEEIDAVQQAVEDAVVRQGAACR